jgi:hypothetical protein
MSLILDALRRAETQRQSQVQPAWSLPQATRSSRDDERSRWLMIGGATAGALALLALAGWSTLQWLGPRSQPLAAGQAAAVERSPQRWPADARATGATAAGPVAAGGATDVAAERPPVRSLAEEVRRAGPGTTRTNTSTGSAPSAPLAADTSGAMRDAGTASRPAPGTVQIVAAGTDEPIRTTGTGSRPAPGTVQIVAAGTDEPISTMNGGQAAQTARAPGSVEIRDLLSEEGIPSNGTIAIAGATPPGGASAGSLPGGAAGADAGTDSYAGLDSAPEEFTLNMLSTSSDDTKSYVYINMRRYRIGEQTPEGAMVEDISNRGAVIAWRGERFLLTLR